MGWLKECRRLATRFDKLALNFLAFVSLALITRYLRLLDPSDTAWPGTRAGRPLRVPLSAAPGQVTPLKINTCSTNGTLKQRNTAFINHAGRTRDHMGKMCPHNPGGTPQFVTC